MSRKLAASVSKGMLKMKKLFHKLSSDHAAKRSKKEQEWLNRCLLNAAGKGKLKETARLIKAGADVSARDGKGMTALMHAASQRKLLMGIFPSTQYLSTCDLLIENGADIEATDNEGNTALMHAAYNTDINTCKLLLDKGAKIYTQNTYGSTATSMAKFLSRQSPHNKEMFKFTVEFLELYPIRKMLENEGAGRFVLNLRACISQ